MSKLSFRARALDPSKSMPIFLGEELPDLPDFSAINRAVPQMPTGMQKEEECEHHLQRAICAGHIIPTPEVTDVPLNDFYDRMYPSNYKQPRQLIHMQPFTMEQEVPDYDMDSDDERWLQAQKPRLDITPVKFEEMMDRLEKSSGQTVVTLAEAKALLKEDDELTIAVFDYWLNKRLKTQHPLILSVRTEHRTGQAANNPYLAFRRRTEKMQTRKNRKNDEVSYEKMLKLRRDLGRAVMLLELVKRREKCKREFVHLTVEVFEKRFQARDYNGSVVAEAQALKAASAPARPAFTPIFHNHNQSWADAVASQVQAAVQHHSKGSIKDELLSRREKRQYKKRKHKSLAGRGGGLDGLSSDEEGSPGGGHRGEASPEPEEPEDEGPFAFRRNRLCSYHKPLPSPGDWPWCSPQENGAGDKRFRFTLTSLSNRKCVGFARRRVGRGGRIILDRAATDCDDFWRGLDFTIVEPKACDVSDPLAERLKVESEMLLRTRNCTSTYNKFSAVAASGSADSGFASGFSADFLSDSDFDRVKVECKTEPPDAEAQVLHNNGGDPGGGGEDTVEFLRALRRDWLHFRPKTPPPDYEPPCHLLPADDPCPFSGGALPSFQMEVEPLDPASSVFVDSSPFLSEPFELDRRWPTDDHRNPKLGPQDPIFDEDDDEETPLHEQMEKEACNSWRRVGVSSFTLRDAGGEVKCQEDEEHGGRKAGWSIGNNANGLLPQITLANDVSTGPSRTSRSNNKLQPYAYGNNAAVGKLSLLTSAQSLTLNSHSANNILEFPLTAAVDVAVDSAVLPAQGSATPTSPAPKTTANSGMRNNKNNTLAMEVT
ncbi:enhancer of polycomb homolog 1 [Euwallacea similis]|uniref:enhancer of polycomb homolog 1 n=1 Tax=Euwallacea similis TaxID=1736056 RepID=UPI00344CEAD5